MEYKLVFLYYIYLLIQLSNQKQIHDPVLYKVQWSHQNLLDTSHYNNLLMVTNNNENFNCYIPRSDDFSNEGSHPYDGPSAVELLMPLFKKQSCTLRLESYWNYELCHGQYIRQFHEEQESKYTMHQEYILGVSSLEAFMKLDESKNSDVPETVIEGVRTPYFAVEYTDGTKCDLTGRPRRTKVIYVCHEDGRHAMYRIKEIMSCEYEITVLTSYLCSHPAYKPQDATQVNVQCISNQSNLRPKKLLELEVESQKLRTQSSDLTGHLQGSSIKIKFDGEDEDTSGTWSSTSRRADFSKPVSADQKLTNEFLNGDFCLEGGTGWWRYEFCYGKSVRQYHDYNDGSKISIVLGTFDDEKHKSWIDAHKNKQFKGDKSSYIAHFYSNGDYCDDVKGKRTVEVKLKCKDSPNINSVSLYLLEPKVCEYVLGVESPLICNIMKHSDKYGLYSKIMKENDKESEKVLLITDEHGTDNGNRILKKINNKEKEELKQKDEL